VRKCQALFNEKSPDDTYERVIRSVDTKDIRDPFGGGTTCSRMHVFIMDVSRNGLATVEDFQEWAV